MTQTLHADWALLPDGMTRDVRVRLDGPEIAEVAAGVAPRPGEARVGLLAPAMPNLHSHAFQRAMAGIAERRAADAESFWTWREAMYGLALTMSPEDVEAVAAQLYVEMLEAGFASVGEFHYLHHDRDGRPYADPAEMAGRIAAAAGAAGVGLTLLPVFYAHSGFGGAPPGPDQRRFICDLDLYARLLEASRRHLADLPGARLGVAPHSLRAATAEELTRVVALAGDGPIHIHVAEQTKEVEDCVAATGARPVRWLLDNAPVDARWCLIHATHMRPDETQDMAKAGATAGLCPLTEANLGDGVFDLPRFLAAGGAFGVGSDSNVQIGLADELRMLEYSQRLALRQRCVAAPPGGSTGRALYQGALAGGAKALGRRIGIAPGADADLVGLDLDQPTLAGRGGETLLDAWAFAGARIDRVWARGALKVARGRHVARDDIFARFKTAIRRLTA
ncbi:MAG: formimidoylglutamate deiminase [Rhodoblastus sp.]|nr:MAG: formimidoylglutamate deiminase [Rhodoblastus sp.]